MAAKGRCAGSKNYFWKGGIKHNNGYIKIHMPSHPHCGTAETEITDIELKKDEGWGCVCFKIIGKDFSCGINVQYWKQRAEQAEATIKAQTVLLADAYSINKKVDLLESRLAAAHMLAEQTLERKGGSDEAQT